MSSATNVSPALRNMVAAIVIASAAITYGGQVVKPRLAEVKTLRQAERDTQGQIQALRGTRESEPRITLAPQLQGPLLAGALRSASLADLLAMYAGATVRVESLQLAGSKREQEVSLHRTSFEARLRGDYPGLVALLWNLERAIPPVVLTRVSVRNPTETAAKSMASDLVCQLEGFLYELD